MIRRVDHTKSLGLTIDDRLSWSNSRRWNIQESFLNYRSLKTHTTLYLSWYPDSNL